MVTFKQLSESVGEVMPHPSQDELRQEVERLRIEIELAAKGIKIEEGDVDVEMMMPPEAILKGFTSPEDFTIKETAIDYGDGSSYQGEMLGALRHGNGTFIQNDGTKYTGQWSYNLLEGRATAVTRSGQTYEGEFRKGRAHGRGKALYENGACYQGEWEADGRHGWGHQLFPNNEGSYEGEWSDDKIHGRGRWTYYDKSFFEGEWVHGERVNGRFVSADGQEEYSGQWKSEQRHGTGVQYRAGIYKYEGSWKDDLHHGQGRCEWVDGSHYDGDWKEGKRNGKGKYTTSSGMKYEGEWLDDMPHGQGICVEDTGDRYMGSYLKGKRHGFGRCLYYSSEGGGGNTVNGGDTHNSKTHRTKYEGEWQEGKRSGQGTCAYANGDVYVGTWANDHRHGYGICKFSDGSKFQGQWEDDGWVQSGAEPTKCYVAGAGVTRGVAGKKVGFKILARDEDGNQRLCGGDEFSIQLILVQEEEEEEECVVEESVNLCIDGRSEAKFSNGANATSTTAITTAPQRVRKIVSVTGEVKDNDDGTYEITYTATTAGVYELNITIGTEHVADSPYPVRIVPAKPYSRNTVVQGQGRAHAVVNTVTQFEIVLFDQYGNQCLTPSPYNKKSVEIPLEAYVEGAGAGPLNANKIPVEIIPYNLSKNSAPAGQEDALIGCYTAPALPGYYRLHVEWDGKALPGTPYSVCVVEKERKIPTNGEPINENEVGDENNIDSKDEAEESNFTIGGGGTPISAPPRNNSTKTPGIHDEMAAWERIAAAAYAVDGVTEGWDSEEDEIKKKETSEDAYINSHPDVPVVENLEDLWLVSKLQKERKAKEEEQKRKKLDCVREKLQGEFGPGQVPTAEEAEMALKEILKEEKMKQEKEKEVPTRRSGSGGKLMADSAVSGSDGSVNVTVERAAEKLPEKRHKDRLSRAELLAAAAALDDIC